VGLDGESIGHQHSGGYTRFVILTHARTGSTLLSRALNSHPRIRSFGEVFNWGHEYVEFAVEGYDGSVADELNLRNTDPIAFLQKRIFCEPPGTTSAVGFKLHYVHCSPPWGFTGLLDYLVQDKGIRILHLQRRNMLKSLASEKMAVTTGEYARIRVVTRPSSIPKGLIHPIKALKRARVIVAQNVRSLRRPRRVTLSAEECRDYFEETTSAVARHDELFREHDKLPLFYEEILSARDDVFARAQSFLGVEPQVLTVGLRKQSPDDLRALIENYHELREAFAGTEYSQFFL
jgi:hypothetical protein